MQYQLTIHFDEESLRHIYAAERYVTLVRGGADADPLVAWLAFQPWQRNLITWRDTYSVYASMSEVHPRKPIWVAAQIEDAGPESMFILENGFFRRDQSGGRDRIAIAYQQGTPAVIRVGLAQAASINGVSTQAPISTRVIATGQVVEFAMPREQVLVFLSPNSSNGSIVGGADMVHPLTVDLEGSQSAAISFDEESGRFQQTTFAAASHHETTLADLVLANG